MTLPLFRSYLVRMAFASQIAAAIVLATGYSGAAQAQSAVPGTQSLIGSNLNCAIDAVADASGNVYIIDEGGNCTGVNEQNTLFKETLQPDGTYVQTIIPTSVQPYTFGFYSVAVDSKGNVFVADQANDRVIEESPNGTGYTESTILAAQISPVRGVVEPGGVAVDSQDNVYISDYNNWQVLKETPNGTTYTQSVAIPPGYGNAAGIADPTCMGFDPAGNLYLCDSRFNLSEWLYSGGTNGTYTKSTTFPASYGGAAATLAVDTAGNYYSSTTKFTLNNGTYLQSPVGNGLGGSSVSVDNMGNIYVAENGATPSIVKYSTPVASAGTVNLGSTGTATIPFLFNQNGSAIGVGVVVRTQGSTGSLDFTDAGTGTCDTNGTAHAYKGGDTCTVVVNFTPQATGVRTGVAQLIFTTGYANGVVFSNSNVTGTGAGPLVGFGFAAPVSVAASATGAAGLAVDAAGDVFIATSPTATTGAVLDEKYSGGTYTGSTALSTAYGVNFSGPTGLAFDNQGDFFVADTANNRIVEGYLNLGSYIPFNNVTGIGTGLNNPKGVAVDALGINVFIADTGSNRIVQDKLAAANSSSPAYAQYVLSAITGLSSPSGISMDVSGNLYIADTGNNRVLKETLQPYVQVTNIGAPSNPPVGTTYVQSVIGMGLSAPQGVFVDGQGNVFIADTGNNRILEESFIGGAYVQSVIPTTGTTLSGPTGVSVDGSHTIYIADTGNNRVIKIGISTAAPTLNFASTAVNSTSSDSPQTLVVTNVGSTPLTISVPTSGTNPSLSSTTNFSLNTTGSTACPSISSTSLAATIAPNATCTLTISFSPTQSGSDSATLTLTDNNNNATAATQVINLIGTGTSAGTPAVMLTPTSIGFGNQTVNTTTAATSVTLKNTGTATLNISNIGITGTGLADFAIVNNTCVSTLAMNASCTLGVTFTPADAVSYSAAVSFTDDATGSPQTVALTGTGVAAPVFVITPGTLAFGDVTENTTSSALSFTITNTGGGTLALGGVTLGGANPTAFTRSGGNCDSIVGSGCTITYTFTPPSTGMYSATVSITDNAAGSPHTGTLTGTGVAATPIAPVATITTPVAFGSQTINTSTTQTLTLSNTGNATLNIAGIIIGGANPTYFTQTGGTCTSSTTLAATSSCTIIITFTPTAVVNYAATVSVVDNAAGSPQIASLSGAGSGATDFGVTTATPTVSVSNGSVAQFTIDVAALSGSYTNPVVMSVTGLPAGATASFNPGAVTPGSAGATTVLSIQVPSLLARRVNGGSGQTMWLATLLLLPLFALRRVRRKLARMPVGLRALLLCALGLGMVLPLTGCGGGFFGPTAHSSTLTVTGTSGVVQHSTTVTLTIQ